MSVMEANIAISVIYSITLLLTLFIYKLSAGSSPEPKPSLKAFNVKKSPYLTIYKYLLMRYTLVSGFISNKKYLLMQLASMSLFQITALRINRVTFWQMAFMPIGLVAGFLANEWWEMRKQSKSGPNGKQEVFKSEEIVRICVILLSVIFQVSAIATITRSVSDIGKLNICTVLICIVCDQLLHRPFSFLIFLGGIKIAQTARKQVLKSSFVEHMLVSEYLRSNLQQRVVPEGSVSSPRKQQISPCKVPKISTSSRFDEPNTLLDVLKQSKVDKKQKEDDAATKIQNICLDDRIQYQQTIQVSEKNSQAGKHSQTSEECLFMDPNKENITIDPKAQKVVDKPQQQNRQSLNDDDLYLAQNIFPTKHEQTLPITITLSPIRQRRPTRSNKRRNNRVLLLTGDSPYLEYLPDMLKKQQSENKVRNKQKLNPMNVVRSDLSGSHIKDIANSNLRQIRR